MCHKEITMSDHRPVSATFELHVRLLVPIMRVNIDTQYNFETKIPTVDTEKLDSLVHDLWKEVSHTEESEDIPRVGVEPNMIDLGKIGCAIRCSL